MLVKNITDAELEMMECFYDPICLIESLFSDLDKLTDFELDQFSEVRLYQSYMLSHEYLLDDIPGLTKKENFHLRSNAGTIYCFGARKFGKSLITEVLDLLVSMIHNDGEQCLFSSYDAMHIRSILEKVIGVLENHPFFKIFHVQVNRNPTYRILLRNGYTCNSVNFNLGGENPGAQFFGYHVTRLYGEEYSFLTPEVDSNRHDAIAEIGCVERLSGMSNFTKYSPIGKIYYELEKQPFIVSYPQYVSPEWGVAEEKKALQHYGGAGTAAYRIFVRGEVVEDGVSVIDMMRVRKNYNYKKTIKHLEINKNTLAYFKDLLIVERSANVSTLYIAVDVGENISEIIIIGLINEVYHYLYNITLYNLTDKEQTQILIYLAEILKANIVAIDFTDGMGRAIFRSLEEVFPKENLCPVGFNEKLSVGPMRDDRGEIMFEDGQIVQQMEYVDSWSIKRLRDHLYEEGKWEIPIDYKFDSQFNSVIANLSGKRVLYTCVSSEDHLLAAFRVFFIAEWHNQLLLINKITKKNFAKSGV